MNLKIWAVWISLQAPLETLQIPEHYREYHMECCTKKLKDKQRKKCIDVREYHKTENNPNKMAAYLTTPFVLHKQIKENR